MARSSPGNAPSEPAVAAVRAGIGVYSVMAHSVAGRTREIGVRVALGARRGQIMMLVLRQGAVLTLAGLLLGLGGAVAATRYLQGMLFGLTPLDATAFMAVALILAAVAMLASYIPARRATKIDPLFAPRAE